jgi:hypothetical protein
MSIKRITISLLVVVGALAPVATAQASDKSLEKALKPYVSKLTTDVAYLANFATPSKGSAGSALTKLSKTHGDLAGVEKVANTNQASSANGKAGRLDVIAGVKDALTATADADAAAKAAKSGKSSTAKSDAKSAKSEIKKAIPLLEAGGTKLKLYG